MSTLIINRYDSRCEDCGKASDPWALTHDVILGYGKDNGTRGCGVRWNMVDSDYAGMKDRIYAIRPDLVWRGQYDLRSNNG